MNVALALGTALAVCVLCYVLYPVFFPPRDSGRPYESPALRPEGDTAVVALREIEFDRATGKLSDSDYATLRQRYVDEAVVEMRRSGTGAAAQADDPVEAAVRAYRATHATCPTCGPRPETDAIYCSNCGHFLPEQCRGCKTTVTVAGATYCPDCGYRLAA